MTVASSPASSPTQYHSCFPPPPPPPPMKIFGSEIFICEPQISTFSSATSHARCQVTTGVSSSTREPHKDVKTAPETTGPHTECLLNKIDTSTTHTKPHYQEELKVLPEAWRKKNADRAHKEDREKSPKKQETAIPCPRCNSRDTKFCYFNNYNVNQPRHFCKKCQRYWTAGGSMRNVPIGAGRRKNKHHFSAHYNTGYPHNHNMYPSSPVVVVVGEEEGEESSTSGSAITSMAFQQSDAAEKEMDQSSNTLFMHLLPPPPPSPLWIYHPLWISHPNGEIPNQIVTPIPASSPFHSNNSSIKQQPSSSPPSSSSSGSSHSAGLGKHVREGRLLEEDGPERSPKTQRVCDSAEALKPPILDPALGVGPQKCEALAESGNFKAFPSLMDGPTAAAATACDCSVAWAQHESVI